MSLLETKAERLVIITMGATILIIGLTTIVVQSYCTMPSYFRYGEFLVYFATGWFGTYVAYKIWSMIRAKYRDLVEE